MWIKTIVATAALIGAPGCAAIAQDQILPFLRAPAGVEQPDLGPSYAVTVTGRLLVADEVSRAMIIFDGPDLATRAGEIPYPPEIVSVRRIEPAGNMVRLIDPQGSSATVPLPSGIAGGAPPAMPELTGERGPTGVELSVGERHAILTPGEPQRSILDWSLVGVRADADPIITWNETDETSVYGVVGRIGPDGTIDRLGEVD